MVKPSRCGEANAGSSGQEKWEPPTHQERLGIASPLILPGMLPSGRRLLGFYGPQGKHGKRHRREIALRPIFIVSCGKRNPKAKTLL